MPPIQMVTANITIRATDQAGNYQDVCSKLPVFTYYSPPVVHDFTVTSIGGNDYHSRVGSKTTIDMTGNLVWIFVDPDIFFSATIQSDGTLVLVKNCPGDPGTYALAWTFDIDDEMSDMVWADII